MSRSPLIRRNRLVPEPAAATSPGHTLGHYSMQRQTDAVAEGAEAETSTEARDRLDGPVRTATRDVSIREGGMAERSRPAHRIVALRVQTRLAVSQPGDPSEQEAERRAQNVISMLNARFGPEHTYSFVGKGAAIDLPEPDNRFGNLIAENGNEDLIEQLIRERAEQYQKDRVGLSPDEARKAAEQDRKSIEANLGKTSNNTLARRVNITVTWSGYNVQWSAPLM